MFTLAYDAWALRPGGMAAEAVEGSTPNNPKDWLFGFDEGGTGTGGGDVAFWWPGCSLWLLLPKTVAICW